MIAKKLIEYDLRKNAPVSQNSKSLYSIAYCNLSANGGQSKKTKFNDVFNENNLADD